MNEKRTYHPPTRWFFAGVVLIVGLAALALRVWGAGWSLPYVDHPDEPAVVQAVLRIVKGDPNPQHFFYPSLILYLQALVFNIHFWWGGQTGVYTAPLTLPDTTFFATSIPQAFVWARVCTAVLGTATVLALATWGGRFVGRREGLLAAALLAFSAWAITHDHYITVDGPSALTGTLALLAALQVLRSGSWRDYILAGGLIGLAAGTKYQNVLVAASVCLAHALHWRGEMFRQGARLVVAGLVSSVVFLLTTPAIIFAFGDFLHDIRTLLESYSVEAQAHGDVTGSWPVGAYLVFYWRECLGPLPTVLALVGGGVLVRRSPGTAAVLLLFPLLMVLSLLRPQTHFYRNLLPTLPPLLLLAGVGGVALLNALLAALRRGGNLFSRVRQSEQRSDAAEALTPNIPPAGRGASVSLSSHGRRGQEDEGSSAVAYSDAMAQALPLRWGNLGRFRDWITIDHLLVGAALVLLLLPSLIPAIGTSSRFAQPDSRVLVQEHARRGWPGVRIASELSHPMRWDGVAQATHVHYLPLYPLEWYARQGYGLVLANSGRRGRDAWTADYEPFLERGRVVASYGGRESSLLGPKMDLIALPLSPETLPPEVRGPQARVGPLQMLGAVVGRVEDHHGLGPVLHPGTTLAPGDTLAINVFWTTTEPVPPAPYTIFVHLRNAQGQQVVQRDAPPWHGLFPPQSWPVGGLVVEQLELPLPDTLAPGSYRLVMGLYNGETWARYPAFAGDTHLEHDEIDLGRVRIE